jgi:mRNA interferase HicA
MLGFDFELGKELPGWPDPPFLASSKPWRAVRSGVRQSVYAHSVKVSYLIPCGMTANELKRRLEKEGCRVEQGTKHWIVYYQGSRTTIPRHPGKEIKTGTYYSILKQLGIKLK